LGTFSWGITVENIIWHGLVLLGDNGAAQPGPGSMVPTLLLFGGIGFLFYLFLIRPQRREQAQRQAMLDAIKKNDHVITAGGIYGVVTNVHREAGEVTIKVDEATNTKLRLALGSVARVLSSESSQES
jgi:preprotein translocase subunit YajC